MTSTAMINFYFILFYKFDSFREMSYTLILAVFMIGIEAFEDEIVPDCNTDTLLLTGPKELAIAILVSLSVGILIGLAARPVMVFTRGKMTHVDAWEP